MIWGTYPTDGGAILSAEADTRVFTFELFLTRLVARFPVAGLGA